MKETRIKSTTRGALIDDYTCKPADCIKRSDYEIKCTYKSRIAELRNSEQTLVIEP
jgi:hypothetical protein